MTKKTYIIIALVVILAIAGFVWWNNMQKVQAPVVPETTAQQSVDTTDTIESDLANIDVGNVEAEFKDVDETIKGL